MLDHVNPENILCLDIETVPQYRTVRELPDEFRKMWLKKAANLKNEDGLDEEAMYKRAGIYAEFGKIICISTGFLTVKSDRRQFRLRTLADEDEQVVLQEFHDLLRQVQENRRRSGKVPMLLCGHNAREFDFPYICRRMVINNVPVPEALDISGKKPWEVPHLDTMELWKFGDFKSYTPLNLLAHVLGIPSPKDDIDGSQVGHVYWEEKNLPRIATYCQKDVITVMQILLRMKNLPLLDENEIEVV